MRHRTARLETARTSEAAPSCSSHKCGIGRSPPPRTQFPTVQNIREVCLNGCMRVSGTARKCSPRRRTNLSPIVTAHELGRSGTRTRATRLAGCFKFEKEAVETGKSGRRGRRVEKWPAGERVCICLRVVDTHARESASEREWGFSRLSGFYCRWVAIVHAGWDDSLCWLRGCCH
jgi:hypothetical protein